MLTPLSNPQCMLLSQVKSGLGLAGSSWAYCCTIMLQVGLITAYVAFTGKGPTTWGRTPTREALQVRLRLHRLRSGTPASSSANDCHQHSRLVAAAGPRSLPDAVRCRDWPSLASSPGLRQ